MMLSVQDSGSTLDYVLWNGSSWGSPSEQETNTGETKNQPFLFIWDQHSTAPDITIDCDFSDWTNGGGNEFVIDDQGGNDDWNNPHKLDLTRFGVASNLTDSFYVLYGYDEVPPNGTAAVLIDTDLDDNINFALAVDVDGGSSSAELYTCDDTLPYGCGGATLSKTYSTPGEYCVGTAAGPWNNDTFIEVALPYADLGDFTGDAAILASLNSYNQDFWQEPKDSIFNDYYDRILYDTGDGSGEIIDDAGTPIITGTVYTDEGTTDIGAGKTVRLLVNGANAGTDTTNANGDYIFLTAVNAGDAILVYIDDDPTYQGNTVTIFDGVQVEGLDIYAAHVITRQDNGGALTNTNMATAKGAYSDGDILYSVAGGTLTVSGSGTELYLPGGHSFNPGGALISPQMETLGTFDGGSAEISVNGTLTISGGSFTSTSGKMGISGDFSHASGAFVHNSGLVGMVGTGQTISGSNDFYHFYKTVTTADTLTFEAGSTQTFAGTVNVQGASGNLLSLRSSSPGTRWNFTVNAGATKSISYVDVKDSDASGSDATHKPINPSNSIDSGNTIDWFPPPTAGSQLVYGEGSVTTPRYRVWDGMNFGMERSAQTADDTIKWVVLKAAPTADELIMGAYSSADKNLYIQTWDGSSWTSNWSTTLDYDGNYRYFDIAYESVSGDAVVVFGEKSSRSLRYRKRVGGTWDSSDQTIGVVTPDDEVYWVRAEPRATDDDIFVAFATKNKTLYALRWDGSSNTWGNQIQTSSRLKSEQRESFDLAFETSSGDAFLIWGDEDKNVWYREFTTSWQPEVTAYASLPKEVLWLVAASDPLPTSSKIAIGMVTDDTTFEFGAWEGSSWVARPAAISARNRDQRGMDVAFETDTGRAVYIFDQNANGQQLAWRTWTSSAGFSSVTVEPGASADINFMQLKPNRSGNEMMAIYADTSADLFHRYWSGSAWSAIDAPLEITLSDADKNEPFMFAWLYSPPTAIDLLSFTATGKQGSVLVSWQTAQEINNLGFNIYRGPNRGGPFTRINDKLIPGLNFTVKGKTYTYVDEAVIPGQLYYYKLEDIDTSGKRTLHGPVCVDWEGDGIPDDWEIAHGLDPTVDDSGLDPDFDGLTNLEEYQRGFDPLNPDSDGDGILDGEEGKKKDEEEGRTGSFTRGVQIISSDETGITLELWTDTFDTELFQVGEETYQRLRIVDYIHGLTQGVGRPELPIKGVLIDLPEGSSATLTVQGTESQTYHGQWVHPVPEKVVDGESGVAFVAEVFAMDPESYSEDAFYPSVVAQLGQTFTFRDQKKLQVLFAPLSFNPATRELKHYSRIRVRVDYVDEVETVLVGGVAMMAAPSTGYTTFAWTPPSPDSTYRILTSDEGIHRLTRTWLESNGVDVAAMDLSQVRLYNLGQEVAISINDLNGDDQFDPADYVDFYATPVTGQVAKYDKYNVYWLTTSGGSGAVKRMVATDAAPTSGQIAASHSFAFYHEQDGYYWLAAPGADSLDRWFFSSFVMGDGLMGGGNPVDLSFTLSGVAGQGSLRVYMGGVFDTDHEVDVSLNGTFLGTYTWSGINFYQATIPAVNLLEGANTLTLQCNSGTDSIALDWIEVVYPRDFAAEGDTLKFSHQGGYRYQVSEFSGNDISAFDITSAGDVELLINLQITGTGPYSLDFEPQTGVEQRTYLVLSSSALKTPVALSEDFPSNLTDPANGADYILITHRDLGWNVNGYPYLWLTDLVSLRESQGLRVKVVDVEDIFDEFSYGLVTPQAIKDFLTHAYTSWTLPAPQYVLLVGDATYDYKDNFNLGTINHVPVYLTFTEHMGETLTDEWFAQVSGNDAIPDLFIGRLPAKTAAEAAIMANKIISYETAVNTKTWEKNIALLADNELEPYEALFEVMNEDAAALLPQGLNSPFKGYLNDYLVTDDLTADIKTSINNGALLVHYSGHGSVQIWAHENVFENADVAELTNGGMLPFVVNMACLTGYLAYPEAWNFPSLAEALVRSDGTGAVAAFMPTGMTDPEGQYILDRSLFAAIFTEDIRTLGPAVSQAKQTLLANGPYEEISETFMLFGDPAMKLKIHLPTKPAEIVAQDEETGVELSWQEATDCDGAPVAGYNLYRSETPGGTYTRVNTALFTGTTYDDTSAESGTTYYYVVTSVDADGDESVQSQEVSGAVVQAVNPPRTLSSSGGGGPCFIGTLGM
jgi:hypothetical protein